MPYAKRCIDNARSFFEGLPDYATTREWARVLGTSYQTLRLATKQNKLAGRRANGFTYHTKREIVAWYAPGLLESMGEGGAERRKIYAAA